MERESNRADEGENGSWRSRAECLNEDPELFFPDGNHAERQDVTKLAKAVCRRCEVITECLEWALDNDQDHGVWGGMSEDERRTLRRAQQRRRRIAVI